MCICFNLCWKSAQTLLLLLKVVCNHYKRVESVKISVWAYMPGHLQNMMKNRWILTICEITEIAQSVQQKCTATFKLVAHPRSNVIGRLQPRKYNWPTLIQQFNCLRKRFQNRLILGAISMHYKITIFPQTVSFTSTTVVHKVDTSMFHWLGNVLMLFSSYWNEFEHKTLEKCIFGAMRANKRNSQNHSKCADCKIKSPLNIHQSCFLAT